MTLNAKIRGLLNFRAISACDTHFKSELRRNQDNVQVKFSALNVISTGFYFGSLRSRSTLYGDVKLSYRFKMRAFGRSNDS